MKTLLAITITLSALLLAADVTPADVPNDGELTATQNADGSFSLHVSKEVMAACNAGGGCILAPETLLVEEVRRAVVRQCGKEI